MVTFSLSVDEYKSRIKRLQDTLQEKDYSGMLLTRPMYIFWLTGFKLLNTERPVVLFVPVEGDPIIIFTLLEKWHWEDSVPWIKDIITYLDYPGDPHCYNVITKILKEKNLGNKKIAIDSLGMAAHAPKPMLGTFKTLYGHGPSFKPHLEKTLPKAKFENKEEILVEWMLILSETEKELIREAAKWGDRAHFLMMEKVGPGSTHWEISHEASLQASKEMIRATGLKVELPYRLPAFVNFHAGPASAYPHAGCKEEYFRKIRVGDTCLSWADANVGGYGIEIERTFFIGPPSERQRKLLEIAIKANKAAFNTIKPGVKCSEVCKASYKIFKSEGVWDLVFHHTGHGKPWLSHVPPYFDIGDHTILRPNMEFSVEPALYVKGLGGFRRGNTIFVTEDGAELVDNKTPMDIEDLIIKIQQ